MIEAPEENPDLHFHEAPNLIPSAEEPVRPVEPAATILIKAQDATPSPHFGELPKMMPSGEEEQILPVEQPANGFDKSAGSQS